LFQEHHTFTTVAASEEDTDGTACEGRSKFGRGWGHVADFGHCLVIGWVETTGLGLGAESRNLFLVGFRHSVCGKIKTGHNEEGEDEEIKRVSFLLVVLVGRRVERKDKTKKALERGRDSGQEGCFLNLVEQEAFAFRVGRIKLMVVALFFPFPLFIVPRRATNKSLFDARMHHLHKLCLTGVPKELHCALLNHMCRLSPWLFGTNFTFGTPELQNGANDGKPRMVLMDTVDTLH